MLIAEHSMCQPGRPSPMAVVHDGSPGLAPFHSAKSRTSSLAYSSASTRSPTRSCSGSSLRQPAVGWPGGDPKEDRAVVGPVGMLALEQRPDERDHLVDVLGGARQHVRPGHPERVGIGQEALEVPVRELVDPDAGRGGATDDLVVDVRDVHDPADGVAAPPEVTDEQVGEEERAEVADVRGAVHRRAARVHADAVVAQRYQRPLLAGQRVLEPDLAHAAASIVASASVEIDRPAPSEPSRLPRGRLDVDGLRREPQVAGDRSPDRLEMPAEPWPRGHDRQVDTGRRASRRPRVARPRPPATSGCRCRRASRHRPGTSGRGRRARRHPATHRRAHAGRRRRPNDRAAAERPGCRRRPDAAARRARMDARRARSRSVGRRPAPAIRLAARARSAGTVTLRLAGSPGTTWTGILQASRRAASSVQVPWLASSEASAVRRMPRRMPCGVCAAASPERSTVAAIRSPSMRLSVSDTGTTGIAAPCAAAASTTAAMSAVETAGRAPSWTRTTRSPSGVGRRALERVEPGSDRVLPPLAAVDERDRIAVRQPRTGLELPPSFRRRHDDDGRDVRCRRAAAASVWASSGRPPILARSLSVPPIRAEPPAATTIASARAVGALNRDAVGRRSCDRPRSGGRG